MIIFLSSVGMAQERSSNASKEEKLLTADAKNVSVNIHYLKDKEKLRVIFVNPKEEKVTVTLKNEKNEAIYSEISTFSSYKRDFDILPLTPGKYIVKVTSKNNHVEKELLIKDRLAEKTVELSSENQVVVKNSKNK